MMSEKLKKSIEEFKKYSSCHKNEVCYSGIIKKDDLFLI